MIPIKELAMYPTELLIGFMIATLALEPVIQGMLGLIKKRITLSPPFGISVAAWNNVTEIPGRRTAKWIGRFERTFFFIAVWIGQWELAGVWLAFKVATKWEVWSNIMRVPDKLDGADEVEFFAARVRWGSRTMQRFLAGTLMNILAAFVGAGVFKLLVELQPCILKCA